MQFFKLKAELKDFPVFSIRDIEKVDLSFHKQRLSEWQAKGYIKKIRQGYYIFSDGDRDERTLFLIANAIYHPSYVSLEMAFSRYGLIPESIYQVTSVTSRKTNHFNTCLGNFMYQHVKPKLFFGYQLQDRNGHRYRIAEIEKAVLDYLYLHPRIKEAADFEGLRFNVDEFKSQADIEKLKKYAEAFQSKALSTRVRSFITYLDHAEPFLY